MAQLPVLKTEGLSKDFGGLRALDRVNLYVEEGEVHSIIGPNGAGKTTLFNLLTGFLKTSEGEIYFNGKRITNYPPYEISRMGIARSFQITSIFPELTVYENIRIGVQSRTGENYKFFRSFRKIPLIEEKAERILLDIGLSEKRGVIAKNLSYGEKRGLEIGIALATEPTLLLLDEPTSGMAIEEANSVIELVNRLSKRITIVLIEHNIDIVLRISRRITVLHQGKVIAEGTPEEIQKDILVQEAYLGGL
jgi:branched-chain amino acid transport system ATP-binding protein